MKMDYNELARKMFLMEEHPEMFSEEDERIIEEEVANLDPSKEEGREFMTAIQKAGVRHFVDFIKPAMVHNEATQRKIESLEEAFFVDGPIEYAVVHDLSKAIALDVLASDMISDKLEAYAEMLVEAIECQKAYDVLEFV